MESKNIKLFAGIGALLAVLTPILGIGTLAGLAGLILIFIAINELSKQTHNKKIYDNFLISFILTIVGGLLSVGVAFFGVIGGIFRGIIGNFGYTMPFETPYGNFGRNFGRFFGNGIGWGIIAGIVIFAIIAYALVIIRSIYLKNSYLEIAKETGIQHFKTAANLMFIGSILSIIGVGFVIYFIGYIFEVIAFFSLPESFEKPASTESSPPLPQS